LEKNLQFDLVDLRLLAAIEDTGSLSKAASTFPIALSAASNRLRKFEERGEVEVFVRSPAGMAATPAGRVILDQVRQLLLRAAELEKTVENLGGQPPISVRMGATAMTTCVTLLSDISLFSVEFPEVEVQLREMDSFEVLHALRVDDIEIGLVDGSIVEADVIHLPFKQENLVLVVASNHPLSDRDTATFTDVLGYQLVGLAPENRLQAYIDDMVAQYKKMLKIRVRAPTLSAVSQLVSQNIGIAIMPESAAHSQFGTSPVRVVSLREPWAMWNSWLCIHSWDKLSAHGRQLLNRLVNGTTTQHPTCHN